MERSNEVSDGISKDFGKVVDSLVNGVLEVCDANAVRASGDSSDELSEAVANVGVIDGLENFVENTSWEIALEGPVAQTVEGGGYLRVVNGG